MLALYAPLVQLRRFLATPRTSPTMALEDMMAKEYQYRAYCLVLRPQGEGWRVDIYAPGSTMRELIISCAGYPAGKDIVVDDAVQIIDRLLQSN